MKILHVLYIFLCISPSLIAQDTLFYDEDTTLASQFDENLDEIINLWYVKQSDVYSYVSRPLDSDTSIVPEFSDEVYKSRIESMQSVVPLVYNKYVRAYINVYGFKYRERVEIMMGLAEYYFPLFEIIFEQYDVPHELKYLAIIESALNPRARSRMGATGLWQFMQPTGRVVGLAVNSYTDKRNEYIHSTHAAAQYLSQLHTMFDDWVLALAAYNCGPGNVRKAIARSGGKRDFWDIYYHLPRETRGYVPAYTAAFYVFEHHAEHNLYPRNVKYPPAVDTVMVTNAMNFSEISLILDIPEKLLHDLNPQYKLDYIPPSQSGMSLYLPVEYVVPFINMQTSIIAYRDSVRIADSIRIAQSNIKVPVNYTVKSGDNLGFIAEWFDVYVSQLRDWNGVRGNTIRVGQHLQIYVPESKKDYYEGFNSMSFAQKQQSSGQVMNHQSTASSSEADGEFSYYTVRSGDTLWDIAQKYNNLTISDLRRLNNLAHNAKIHPGMVLKIKNL